MTGAPKHILGTSINYVKQNREEYLAKSKHSRGVDQNIK